MSIFSHKMRLAANTTKRVKDGTARVFIPFDGVSPFLDKVDGTLSLTNSGALTDYVNPYAPMVAISSGLYVSIGSGNMDPIAADSSLTIIVGAIGNASGTGFLGMGIGIGSTDTRIAYSGSLLKIEDDDNNEVTALAHSIVADGEDIFACYHLDREAKLLYTYESIDGSALVLKGTVDASVLTSTITLPRTGQFNNEFGPNAMYGFYIGEHGAQPINIIEQFEAARVNWPKGDKSVPDWRY